MIDRRRIAASVVGCALTAAASGAATTAEAPADAPPEAGASVPQEGFLSSFKQAFKEDFEREVVRGHFDVGVAPDTRRFYCLVDARSGRREPKAVSGEPVKRSDGMTGIKAAAVSLYGCDTAEQRGLLVTTGYALLGGAAGGAAAASATTATAATTTGSAAAPVSPPAHAPGAAGMAGAEVAGVRLGMSVDEVRAVLKAKRLSEYFESTERLWPETSPPGFAPGTAGRFVNVIAAWSPPTQGASESYRVLFTPVPGRERAMAVVHVTDYAVGAAPLESLLDQALRRKYGGYAAADELPPAATWRIQSGGEVLVGDACGRRELFGGAAGLGEPAAPVANAALKTTPAEFRYQLDRCGAAIVTADHTTANPAAPAAERSIAHLAVSAYSPVIAFEGSTAAAQLMQAAGSGAQGAPARGANAVPLAL